MNAVSQNPLRKKLQADQTTLGLWVTMESASMNVQYGVTSRNGLQITVPFTLIPGKDEAERQLTDLRGNPG